MTSPMIRTRSFAEILDDLVVPGEDGTDTASQTQSFSGVSGPEWLFSLFGQDTGTVALPRAGGTAASFYSDEVGDYTEEAGSLVASIVDMTDEDRIAAELDLESAASVADLARARRAFALRNHPDLFHPRLRAIANGRMQLANMLLDRRRREIEAGR